MPNKSMKTCYIEDFVNSTKMAVIENEQLMDLIIEKNDESIRVKDIYAGRVEKVFPGMEACFVDIGDSLPGYLKLPKHTSLKVGDRVLVQVKKADKEKKRLTLDMEISLGARGLVYIPDLKKIIFSKSICDSHEKFRIKKVLPESGFLVRTKAKDMNNDYLYKESKRLIKDYEIILEKFMKNTRIGLIRPAESKIFDYIGECIGCGEDSIEIDRIVYSVYDFEEGFNSRIRKYIRSISDDLLLKLDKKKNIDIFEAYGVNTKIGNFLSKRVDTKEGPYIIIERTEALTIIDVNTGSFVGYSNYQNTVVMANKIAAKEIIRQILIRDLSGIILIDFVDMENKVDRDSLVDFINRGLSKDERIFKVHGYTSLGLLEISRARKSKSILEYYECVDQKDLIRKPSFDSIMDEVERRVQIEVYHKLNKRMKLSDILYEYRLYEIEKILKKSSNVIKKIEKKYDVNIEY